MVNFEISKSDFQKSCFDVEKSNFLKISWLSPNQGRNQKIIKIIFFDYSKDDNYKFYWNYNFWVVSLPFEQIAWFSHKNAFN